jgi:N-acetylglutamate synthase-like GNAT family acetyltransferase
MIEMRPFQEEDWKILLNLANQAVPFASQENAEWLEYRINFDESRRTRRHYIATNNKNPIGYGCLEQQSDDLLWLRVYVVCSPEILHSKVGKLLYEKLLQDARELGALHLWARELQEDEPIREFLAGCGFVEVQRFALPDQPPMVVYNLDLGE